MRHGWPALLTAALAAGCSSSHPASSSTPTPHGSSLPSCAGSGTGISTCGDGSESCCTSSLVPTGTFDRSYDGISTNGKDMGYAATISSVSVDRYEVTVARFRAFMQAEVAGWKPSAGAGKHTELSGGGLNDGSEPGWSASWDTNLATSFSDWNANLACDPAGAAATYATWTVNPGKNEDHPINCVSWYEAYAFCIWDGGFLPSEAEWNYTASGGSDQRLYPWSAAYPPGSDTLDCDHADYSTSWPGAACVPAGTNRVGSESPSGDGKWGHSDLAGNVFEWVLDWYSATYPSSCDDCANLTEPPAGDAGSGPYRVIRGGSFDGSPACLLNSLRETSIPDGRSSGIGFRCARPPE